MLAFRSLLFNAFFYGWTLVWLTLCLPVLLLPPSATYRIGRIWARVILSGLAAICGLRHRIVGLEHLPTPPYIVAAKHQSAWDTLVFCQFLDFCSFVMKRELMWIPLFGWYLKKAGMLPVDRRAGAKALQAMIRNARPLVADRRELIVFPEGTRVAVGARRPYLPGVAALYTQLELPVVPVAVNSGLFWSRRSFAKKPGIITLEILPPIAPGKPRKAFLAELEQKIEDASRRLAREAARAQQVGLPGQSSVEEPVD